MRRLLPLLLVALGPLALGACADAPANAPATAPAPSAEAAPDSARVVALGGAVAETVYALGAGDALVARDASALVPAAVLALPSVGYYRQLGAEGLLSTRPTLVLADPAAGPPTALAQVEAAGVRVVRLPGGPSVDEAVAQIRAVGAALGREAEASAVVDALAARLAEVAALVEAAPSRPRVLFVLGQGGGALQLGGTGTAADALLRLAGGTNAFGAVEGYTPMTPEALVTAAPDVIFMLGRTAEAVGGADAFARRPEVAATPAARAGRLLVLPDAALNFGPGLGDAALDFARRLHGAEPDTAPPTDTAAP